MEYVSENAALIEHLEQQAPLELVQISNVVQVAAVPAGKTLVNLKPYLDTYLEQPERAVGTAIITDLQSFVEFVNRGKRRESVVFACNRRDAPSLTAVFDYNVPEESGGVAGWGQHRAEHTFPLSEEWKAWLRCNGRPMSQEAFAEWIEDRILDVVDPSLSTERTKEILAALGGVLLASASKLLALSKGLTVHIKSQLENHSKLASGEVNLVWKTEHQDADGIKLVVPGAFLIGVSLFGGGVRYPIIVRLKYRAGNGKVEWSYSLYRTEEFFDKAIAESCAFVREKTGLPVILGTPELPANMPTIALNSD